MTREDKIKFIIRQERLAGNLWKWIEEADDKTVNDLYDYWTQEIHMNLIELEKHIKEHKIIEAIKDGIADGLLHGERDDTKSHHYYKIGYDYGCVMFDMLGTDVCRTKINDKEIA